GVCPHEDRSRFAETDPSPGFISLTLDFATLSHKGRGYFRGTLRLPGNRIETGPPSGPAPPAKRDCPMTEEINPLDKARILSHALPNMEEYDEETIVIKYGGHAMGDDSTARAFARDIVLLEQTAINPVVVHGGGPQIATMLKRLGIQSEFAAGLRIT